jgi:hypothetical protein
MTADASFETRLSGAPQDEGEFVDGIKKVPHPEVRSEAEPRRTYGADPSRIGDLK